MCQGKRDYLNPGGLKRWDEEKLRRRSRGEKRCKTPLFWKTKKEGYGTRSEAFDREGGQYCGGGKKAEFLRLMGFWRKGGTDDIWHGKD